eukprot:1263395-Rhodomonas_salina.1
MLACVVWRAGRREAQGEGRPSGSLQRQTLRGSARKQELTRADAPLCGQEERHDVQPRQEELEQSERGLRLRVETVRRVAEREGSTHAVNAHQASRVRLVFFFDRRSEYVPRGRVQRQR